VLKIKIKCAAKGRLRVAHFKATAATKGDVEQTAKHMPQNVATVASATAKIDTSLQYEELKNLKNLHLYYIFICKQNGLFGFLITLDV